MTPARPPARIRWRCARPDGAVLVCTVEVVAPDHVGWYTLHIASGGSAASAASSVEQAIRAALRACSLPD